MSPEQLRKIPHVRVERPNLPQVQDDSTHLWAVSYADFLMVLLCFFILFFSVDGPKGECYAVHRREWKLVIEGDKTMLFRIVEDPNETTDLAAKEPKLVADLTAVIGKWKQLNPKDAVRQADKMPAGYKTPPMWAEAAR